MMMLNTKMMIGVAILAVLSVSTSAAGDRQTRKTNLRKHRRNKMIHSNNNNNNNNVDITEDVAFWTRSLQSSFPPSPTPVPPPTPSGGV